MRHDIENSYNKQVEKAGDIPRREISMTGFEDFSEPEQELEAPQSFGPRKEPILPEHEAEQQLRERKEEEGLPRWYGPRKGEIETEDNRDEEPYAREVLASPIIMNLARELDIDLRRVKGSGDDGRILYKDIAAIKPEAAALRQRRRAGDKPF